MAGYISHRAVMVAIGDLAPGSDARDRFETLFIERSAKEVAAFIAAGQPAGTVDPELHPPTVAAPRGVSQLVGRGSRPNLARVTASYTSIVWKTLYAPPGTPDP